MSVLVALLVGVVVKLALSALERTDTPSGARLRSSTWQAWKWTVEEREAELAELRRMEPPL